MSMKNIFRNILACGAAIVLLASCDMNLTPTTQIAYDENEPLFTTEADVVQFMRGVMSSYRSLQYGGYAQTPDLMCDGFNAVIGYGNQYGPVHRTDDSFTSSDGYTEAMWANNYIAIKNYNIVITGASKNVPEELKPMVDIVKGYALFCRASSYLNLARYYGKDYDPATANDDLCVPRVIKYDQLEKPSRATVQEIYDLIYDDLSEAEMLLADEYGEIGWMYPTIDAVKALFARYYLDIHDYENAYSYAREVIESPAGYKLSSNINEMTAEFTNDNGTEPIMQLYATKAEGAVANSIYTPVEKDDVGKFFRALYLPTAKLVNAYDAGDLRQATWFSNSLYPVFVQGVRYNGITVFTKYLGNPTLTTGEIETGAHAAKPLMIAEMYLIAAEAYAQFGNTPMAKKYLNELQTARGASPTSGDLANVQNEWFRETVGDGQRLICLKRWGQGFSGRPAQAAAASLVVTGEHFDGKVMEPGNRAFTWPIPAYELKLNTNLYPQNDGYSVNE